MAAAMSSAVPAKSVATVAGQLVVMAVFVAGLGWGGSRLLAGRRPPVVAVVRTASGVAPRDRTWPTSNPSPATVDLLAGLDLSAATVSGQWTRRPGDGALVSDDGQATRFDTGYRPPAEYDLRYTITRLSGSDGVDAVLAVRGRQFAWTIAGWANTLCGFGFHMGQGTDDGPTATRGFPLVNGRRYAVEVRVRRDGVSATIDGRPVVRWATDYDDLACNTRDLNRPDTIGFSTWESRYAIASATVTEVSGTGRRVSSTDPLEAVPIATVDYHVAHRGEPPADPIRYTVYSNGHLQTPTGENVWYRRGDDLVVQWGPVAGPVPAVDRRPVVRRPHGQGRGRDRPVRGRRAVIGRRDGRRRRRRAWEANERGGPAAVPGGQGGEVRRPGPNHGRPDRRRAGEGIWPTRRHRIGRAATGRHLGGVAVPKCNARVDRSELIRCSLPLRAIENALGRVRLGYRIEVPPPRVLDVCRAGLHARASDSA